jgi:hypothetical protein
VEDGAGWRETVRRFWDAMSAEEADEFRAAALIALDDATRMRQLTPEELARLTALAEYIGDRLSRRTDPPIEIREAVLYGLLAGYQLAVGQPSEPS